MEFVRGTVIYVAYDPERDRKVAIKLVRAERSQSGSSGEARTCIIREAQALAKLSHGNVVAVYDVGAVGEDVWLAMELVEGQTLAAWCAQARPWRELLDAFGCPSDTALEHEPGASSASDRHAWCLQKNRSSPRHGAAGFVLGISMDRYGGQVGGLGVCGSSGSSSHGTGTMNTTWLITLATQCWSSDEGSSLSSRSRSMRSESAFQVTARLA